MSTDATATPEAAPDPTETAPTPSGPSVKELGELYTKIMAYGGAVKDAEAVVRAQVQQAVLDLHAATGTKAIIVRDDEGEELVNFSVTGAEAKDEIKVTDPDAFLDWVMRTHPTEVETVFQVRPAFKDALLGRLKAVDGVLYDKTTGERFEAPGVEHKHTPAGDPDGIRVNWKRGTQSKPGGKERALQWTLTHGGPGLPELEV